MKNLLLAATLTATLGLFAQTPNVTLQQVANITTSPSNKVTSIANCGDGRLFFTEAPGRIKFFDPYTTGGVTTATTFMNIVSRVKSTGNEQGLLGLAFAPDYATSGRFYVNYTNTTSVGNTTISRFTVSSDPNAGNAASEEILLTITQPYTNHNGGNILFGPDGYLYIGMGDGGSAGDPNGNGQNGATYLGKMLRIDVSGATGYSIPSSNPFLAAGDNILDEIWAIGVRNPWKYSFDKLNGNLWIADVGQDLYEEVNYIQGPDTGGQNYGWKCREGLHAYSSCTAPNRTDPVFEYAHGSTNGCSITGGYVNRGNLYASLYGRYFVTDYCSGRIWSLIPNANNLATSTDHGVYVVNKYTTFGQDVYGEVYLAEQTGKISRLTSTTGSPMALISADGNLTICPGQSCTLRTGFNPLLSYQWYLNDVAISNATSSTYAASEAGNYKVEVTRTGAPSSVSDSITIQLYSVPMLTASAAFNELCADAAFPIALTGSPVGGSFSGTNVTDSNFDPYLLPAGDYLVSYNYTTSDGCQAVPATTTITLNPLPIVTIEGLDNSYCIYSNGTIPTLTPTGGNLSGPGLFENTFIPANAGLGQHQLSYTYADSNGCANTASITISVEECLSIEDASKLGIEILPNPFHGSFTVRFTEIENSIHTLEVYSINGQKLKSISIENSINNQQVEIDLSNQAPGIYFLHLKGSAKQHVIKLVQE